MVFHRGTKGGRGTIVPAPVGGLGTQLRLAFASPDFRALLLTFVIQALGVGTILAGVDYVARTVLRTPLASIIGFVDLTKAGTMLNNATFRPFLVYSLVALIYFALCFPLSWYAHRLERQLHVAR